MFNRSKALVSRGKALAKSTKRAKEFFSNPKNLKLFQQYLKVFIAYGQVNDAASPTVLCFVPALLAPHASGMHFPLMCAAADLGHQVLGSFVGFKVEWPVALGKTIGWVMNVSTLLK
jgi:hypothetical protein